MLTKYIWRMCLVIVTHRINLYAKIYQYTYVKNIIALLIKYAFVFIKDQFEAVEQLRHISASENINVVYHILNTIDQSLFIQSIARRDIIFCQYILYGRLLIGGHIYYCYSVIFSTDYSLNVW